MKNKNKSLLAGIVYFILAMIIFVLFLLVWANFFSWADSKMDKPFMNACKDIGFDGYRYINRIDYCYDNNHNLYSVYINCSGEFTTRCKAQQINISSYTG